MKKTLAAASILSSLAAFSQANTPAPVEQTHTVSHWWWLISVAVAFALGIAAYMLIKKNPRKDAE